jgi:hypothetical protein
MSAITQHLCFYNGCVSFSIIASKFIHAAAWARIAFFFRLNNNLCISLLICPLTDLQIASVSGRGD